MIHRYESRRRFLPILFAIIGSLLVLNLIGNVNLTLEPVELGIKVSFGFPGSTSLVLPPIGSISAFTHPQPIKASVALNNVDLSSLQQIVLVSESDASDALVNYFRANIQKSVIRVILQLMIIGGFGGILGVLFLGNPSIKLVIQSFIIGLVVVGVLLGSVYFTYDPQAFENPRYQGIIEAAPWMVGLIQESVVKVEELGEQIQLLLTNLYHVFNQIENLQTVGVQEVDLTILHVSDIHNHPVAYDFIKQIIASFPIDMVIDTGDLTDWGTPLEAEIVNQIEQLRLPYAFVSGNHDAPDVIDRLVQTDNVYIIDLEPQEILGLKIAGISDPSADSYSPQIAPLDQLGEIATFINDFYRDLVEVPDIFAVHNHRIANAIEPGIFPVVLTGHSHVQAITQVEDTVYINAGTTGASGIRGLQTRDLMPFSLAILYFQKNGGQLELVAVDGIQVQGLTADFSLDRSFVFREGEQEESVEIIDEIFDQ